VNSLEIKQLLVNLKSTLDKSYMGKGEVTGVEEELKKVIDANTQIGQGTWGSDTSDGYEELTLTNTIWEQAGLDTITEYPDGEQIYFMYSNKENIKPVKMGVMGRPKYRVFRETQVLTEPGDIQPNKLYMFKLSQVDLGDFNYEKAWLLFTLSQPDVLTEAEVKTLVESIPNPNVQ